MGQLSSYPARVCASAIASVRLSVCPSIILKYLSDTSLRGIVKLHERHQNSPNRSILASVYLAEVKAVALAVISSGYRSQALLYTHSDQRYIRRYGIAIQRSAISVLGTRLSHRTVPVLTVRFVPRFLGQPISMHITAVDLLRAG